MTREQEIERKFTASPQAALPSLPDSFSYGGTDEFDLSATYFDTPDLLLARNRRTLRRRTGGDDAGWHLKLPAQEGARTEVRLPLEAGVSPLLVPAGLRAEVADLIETRPLIPVAELTTRRRQTVLLAHNAPAAVVADDTVRSRRLPDGEPSTWREIEVELTGGGTDVLDAITAHWMEQGVTVSPSASKLAQTLGEAVAQAERRVVNPGTPAAAVALDYLAAQVGMLQSREPDLATDAPDAVHKSRVATRRLRSAFTTWSCLWKDPRLKPLAAEVKWLGEVLGAPRDAEVMRDTLVEQAQDLLGAEHPGIADLRDRLETAHAQALADLSAVRQTARYWAVHERLVDLLLNPPVVKEDGTAEQVMPDLLARAGWTVRKHHRSAEHLVGDQRLHELHETRKKAKRARYAAETAAPALGADAQTLAKQWEGVTESLGRVQDSVVARQALDALPGLDPSVVQALRGHQDQVRDEALASLDPHVLG